MKKIITLIVIAASLSSCVSSKIHKDLQSKYDTVLSEKDILEEENQSLNAQLADSKSRLELTEKELSDLKDESDLIRRKLSALEKDHNALTESYKLLTGSNNKMLAKNAQKNLELLQDLEKSRSLLEEENAKLKAKEKKIAELEYLMKERENMLSEMKRRISDALLGFKGKGLTVEQRNGKVYVSLENRLLFPSGSWQVNPQGQKAINDLANVLKTQNDINILIEGHTDNVGTEKYNMDLSSRRGKSVRRYLTENFKVQDALLKVNGYGEIRPLAENTAPEERRKNRRVEIVAIHQ